MKNLVLKINSPAVVLHSEHVSCFPISTETPWPHEQLGRNSARRIRLAGRPRQLSRIKTPAIFAAPGELGALRSGSASRADPGCSQGCQHSSANNHIHTPPFLQIFNGAASAQPQPPLKTQRPSPASPGATRGRDIGDPVGDGRQHQVLGGITGQRGKGLCHSAPGLGQPHLQFCGQFGHRDRKNTWRCWRVFKGGTQELGKVWRSCPRSG